VENLIKKEAHLTLVSPPSAGSAGWSGISAAEWQRSHRLEGHDLDNLGFRLLHTKLTLLRGMVAYIFWTSRGMGFKDAGRPPTGSEENRGGTYPSG